MITICHAEISPNGFGDLSMTHTVVSLVFHILKKTY